MTDKPTITQDYHAATRAFDNVLGHAGSYAEYGRPSDREAGVRSLTQDLAKHRESSVAELQVEVERKDAALWKIARNEDATYSRELARAALAQKEEEQ